MTRPRIERGRSSRRAAYTTGSLVNIFTKVLYCTWFATFIIMNSSTPEGNGTYRVPPVDVHRIIQSGGTDTTTQPRLEWGLPMDIVAVSNLFWGPKYNIGWWHLEVEMNKDQEILYWELPTENPAFPTRLIRHPWADHNILICHPTRDLAPPPSLLPPRPGSSHRRTQAAGRESEDFKVPG
ncbi:hypothetical protein C8J57DRAFT_1251810 [Mycena rebaudengoi]|nr:hypothetical protein C8J57DRAFT_1251810 [Mycena rebaudengoi]